jgi:hypothetical protein
VVQTPTQPASGVVVTLRVPEKAYPDSKLEEYALFVRSFSLSWFADGWPIDVVACAWLEQEADAGWHLGGHRPRREAVEASLRVSPARSNSVLCVRFCSNPKERAGVTVTVVISRGSITPIDDVPGRCQ